MKSEERRQQIGAGACWSIHEVLGMTQKKVSETKDITWLNIGAVMLLNLNLAPRALWDMLCS